ncbi:MAG TPA: 1-(5-phosphoribosyl)-5-[(5-phosphoribosylamino)methylideneamino]imidazole-4-carboxamide isomerase [Fimbriimonadaceae bacterium]|jgi:phosphoribosylformimino-5-aminoimidazole carboxamide ribotide isomerase
MLILPAIDLRGGKCVRLTQGDYAQEKVYDSDPAAVAASFEEQGAQFLHVVDLDGAKDGAPKNLGALKEIIKCIRIPVEFGGGIRSLESAQAALELGVSRVIIGTKLVQDRALASRMFETLGEKVVAGIDAKNGKVAVAGWIEQSAEDAFLFAKALENDGAQRFIVTDIATDGALMGPNLDFLALMADAVISPVIASGGVSSIADLAKIKALSRTNLEGVIVGKAIYEKRFSIEEALAVLAS